MHHPSPPSGPAAAGGSLAAALFQRAASAGHWTLGRAELGDLLALLGTRFADDAASATAGASVDLRVSLCNTREFGLVLSAGLGGVDAEFEQNNFRTDRAVVQAAVPLCNGDDFLQRFKRTLAYQRIAGLASRGQRPAPDHLLERFFEQLLQLALRAAPDTADAPWVVQALELDLVLQGDVLLVAGGSCTLGAPPLTTLPRPIAKIDKLLHPASIGIIGVSATGMNFGRIILRNLVGSGYSKTRLCIIRPGESEIDGVRCIDSLKSLTKKLDLLIVAIAADAVGALVDEIIESDAVESVMLIPGGLGETKKSREPAAAMAVKINAAHGRPGGGPIFLGANCLGVVSHPGAYDSWFIPLERLPKPQKKPERNSVLLSQSGAFMITRLSQNPWLDPRYMLALGNQTDLTHGDLLSYFALRPEIETIGVYIEGFKDLDGLHFAQAVRAAVLAGKQVVVYKAGRSVPGMGGVLGHTASIAGNPLQFEAVLRQAGAIVVEDFNAFDDLLYIAGALHHKQIGGNRLGAISGAGFEAVGMADNIHSETFSMQMGELEADTIRRIEEILVAKKLDALVEVRNPLDINPGADDDAHLRISAAFLDDPHIDAVLVGLDPTAPSVRSLEQSKLRPGYDITDPNSTVQQMPPIVAGSAKPFIGVIDGGTLYDAMAARLMDQGVCVFRNCARAAKALVRYCEARLYADSIRQRRAKI